MENLIELLSTLNRGELELLRINLDANPNLKRTKLIRRLLSEPNLKGISYDDLGLKGSSKYQLAYNTKEWLFGLILQQDEKSKLKSELGRKRMLAYKYLFYAYLCVTRGIRRDSVEYLVKAQKIAREYEFINIEMEAVSELILENIYKDGHKQLKALKKRQEELRLFHSAISETQWIRYELFNDRFDNANWDSVVVKRHKSIMSRVKKLANKTGLVRIQSFYLHLEYTYFNETRKFEGSLNSAKEYLNLVEKSPMIRSTSNRAGGNMRIATTLNRLGKFKKALPHSRFALKYFGYTKTNVEIGSHVVFTCLFHLKKYEEAKALAIKNYRSKWIKKYPMRKGKWHFFEAAIYFSTGDYNQALKSLRSSRVLMKDKSGWQYGYRILEILIQYEHVGSEILENYINNFRRFIRKHTVESKTRISLILKVLSALERSQFDFKRIARSHAKILRTLEAGDGLYFYEPSGFEIVRFDKWFRKHLKKKLVA